MNVLTEAEAAKKICPRAPGTGNLCVGSYCMAWRWKTYSNQFNTGDPSPTKDRVGFCGLAGKP